MALTKIVNPTADNAYKPTKSALKTFANILNTGMTIGGLAGKADDIFKRAGSTTGSTFSQMPNKSYSLGIETNAGANPAYLNNVQNTLDNPLFKPGQITRPNDLTRINPGSITR